MNFLKKLFTATPSTSDRFYTFSVKCRRCGEIVHGQVNVYNEPSLDFDEKGKPVYICRKVLRGEQLCPQQIEVIFKFNEARGVLDKQITGGEFVDG
jgi:hypothetical protein